MRNIANKKTLTLLIICGIVTGSISTRAFFDGANAVDLIGHYLENDGVTPDYTESVANDTPGLYGLSSPGSGHVIDSVNHRLFIVDGGNHRVLVFNLDSSNQLVDRTPDNVLGQPSFYTAAASTTQSRVSAPSALALDSVGQRLFVSESSNNRVTVFDVSSITNGEPAINVLGQATFTTAVSATTQSGMVTPRGLAYDPNSQRLFVANGSGSNRVTIYDVASITDGENAINVLGQSNFTNTTAATTQAGMNFPAGIALDVTGQRLFVSQMLNHRVTVYDVATSTITNGANAINVLGQTTYTGASSAVTQGRLSSPLGLEYDQQGQRLFVAEQGNSRVLVFDTASITNGELAVYVIGQPNFTTSTGVLTQYSARTAQGTAFDPVNQRLYVAQGNPSHRVSVFDVATSTITNGSDAIDLLGHYTEQDGVTPDYSRSTANDIPGRFGLAAAAYSSAIDTVNHRLFIVDASNSRVLIFNLDASNRLLDRIPDNVLGQSTFYTNTATTTQSGLNFPSAVTLDQVGQRLFVVQSASSRVSVFDISSITNGENAINVLGQTTFTGSGAATTQTSLNGPVGAAYDGTTQRLFVTDGGNSRVVVYDVASITDGEAAVNVLGQSVFTTSSSGNSQSAMSSPTGITIDETGQRLFVSQANDHVNVFDISSITDGENAVNILGSTDYTSGSGSVTQSTMMSPEGMAYDSYNKRLFVAQQVSANRVTVYDVTSITDGEDAVNVLGQSTFTGSAVSLTQSGFNLPLGLTYNETSRQLLVHHAGNVAFFNVAPLTVELSAATASSTDESSADNFPVLLIHGTTSATSTVELNIDGGTASTGDFTSDDPIVITIPPGAYDGSIGTGYAITAPTLIQDTTYELGGETITFTLQNPTNVLIGDANSDAVIQSTHTYTISDDDSEPVIPAPVVEPAIVSVTVPALIGPIGGSAAVPVPPMLLKPVPATPSLQVPMAQSVRGILEVSRLIQTRGLRSLVVVSVQKILNLDPSTQVAKSGAGSPGKETSYYGPATRAAVGRFQLKHKIIRTSKDSGFGLVGPKTKAKLNEVRSLYLK